MNLVSSNKELVERDRQLLQLDSLYAECLSGRGGAAIIVGPVAGGKTALLHHFLDQAADAGAVVLTAAASRAERTLPLGVVDQLFQGVDLPPEDADTVSRLIENTVEDPGCELALLDDPHKAQLRRRLFKALLKVADGVPLVIAVDDAHHADPVSQQCLASLARRLRGTRIMVVLTESAGQQPGDPLIRAEMLRDAHNRLIQLEPLSRDGTAELLARYPDLFPESRVTKAHQATGGNPLLLHALAEDARTAGPATRPDRLVVGERFAEAVRTCLYRSDAAAPRIAQGLAVLGEGADPALLARLLDTSAETVGRTIDQLNRSGLLDAGWFRRPAARTAVVGTMEPEEFAVLHARAAYLTHSGGAPALSVSRHLVNADRIEADWGVPALLEAAEQAIAHGDIEHSLACLRAAESADAARQWRAQTVALLVRAKWRTNPAQALPLLPEVIGALRDGRLDARHAVVPVTVLIWYGRVSQAEEILDAVVAEDLTPVQAESFGGAVLWLAVLFPDRADQARAYFAALARKTAGVESPSCRAARALQAVLDNGPAADTVTEAELVLHRIRLCDETLAPALVSLTALIFAGALDAADFWCETLMRAARGVPTWQAVLLALRAEIAMLRGDVAKARADAGEALIRVPARGWGLILGCVLSTLITASTEGGDYAAAAGYLNERVPADLAQTPFGLRYAHARGQYYLATGRAGDAMIDFQTCGRLAGRSGLDHPALVPWRTSAAQAHLAAGRPRQAATLVEEQLALLGPTGQDRIRGICLRVLAGATPDLKRRPEMLRESIELLKSSGDWLEAARAFAGLSDALNEAGETNRARLTLRTARHIAKKCQAEALLQTLYPQTAAVPEPAASFEPLGAELSEAESRVASLAALGYTNREIAGLLFVTMSTVEQHLTRVYRKLGVSRRMDLPSKIDSTTHT